MIQYTGQESPIIGVWKKDTMAVDGESHPRKELAPISVVTYAPLAKSQSQQ